MPEPTVHRQKLHAGEPLTVGDITFLTIERVAMDTVSGTAHAWLNASKEPVALLMRDLNGIHIVPIGAALSADEIRSEIPGLDDLIAP